MCKSNKSRNHTFKTHFANVCIVVVSVANIFGDINVVTIVEFGFDVYSDGK